MAALFTFGMMSGAAALGHPKAAVEEIFEQMAKFSGYGFNQSHSAAYALVAYQTAFLKTHYPVEFMAALLTSETSKPENVVKYIGECKEMGIPVEPPDVQVSGSQFTPHITPEGEARLRAQPWRGNVRELAHEIERAVIFSTGSALDFAQLGWCIGVWL